MMFFRHFLCAFTTTIITYSKMRVSEVSLNSKTKIRFFFSVVLMVVRQQTMVQLHVLKRFGARRRGIVGKVIHTYIIYTYCSITSISYTHVVLLLLLLLWTQYTYIRPYIDVQYTVWGGETSIHNSAKGDMFNRMLCMSSLLDSETRVEELNVLGE